jgi:enoyl-CoA hydratase/carnithine racemase
MHTPVIRRTARIERPLLRADHAGVAVLTLNRPERYNALSSGLLHALHAEVDVRGG